MRRLPIALLLSTSVSYTLIVISTSPIRTTRPNHVNKFRSNPIQIFSHTLSLRHTPFILVTTHLLSIQLISIPSRMHFFSFLVPRVCVHTSRLSSPVFRTSHSSYPISNFWHYTVTHLHFIKSFQSVTQSNFHILLQTSIPTEITIQIARKNCNLCDLSLIFTFTWGAAPFLLALQSCFSFTFISKFLNSHKTSISITKHNICSTV